MGAEAGPSRRTVLLHGGVYTASRILNQGVVFLFLPVYAHLLGPEGFGIVEVMAVTRSFLVVLMAQGLDMAWFRLRFEIEGPEDLRRFESTVVWYLLASGAVGFGALVLLGPLLGPVVAPGIPFAELVLFTGATAAAMVIASLLERRLQAEQRPVPFALFSLLRTVTSVASILVFVVMLDLGAPGKIEAEALAAVVAAGVALLVLSPGFVVSRPHLGRALAYGLPLVPHALAGLVNDLADRFLLSGFLGAADLGVYSMGYRLASISMVVMVATNQALAPVFIDGLRRAEKAEGEGGGPSGEADRRKVASLGFLMILLACATVQAVTAVSRELLVVMTTPEFEDSWRVVPLVSSSVVAWAWYSTFSQSVMYRPSTVRQLALVTVAAAITNVLANLVLIPRMGILGAAWATLLSNSVMAGFALVLGMRAVRLPYALSRWAGVTAFTLASLAVLWVLDSMLDGPAARMAAKAAWLSVALAVTVRLSGYRLAQLRGLWQSRRVG